MITNKTFFIVFTAMLLSVCGALIAKSAQAADDPVYNGPLNFIIEEEDKGKLNYRKVFEQLPEDVQDDLMKEAEQQYNICSSKGAYSKYYDCRCIAVKFLDKRIEVGPNMASQNIVNDITLECPYEAGIAGISYSKCEDIFAMDIVGDLESFCTCFANSVAKGFVKKPSMHSQYVSFLQQRAMSECGYQQEMQNYRKLQKQRDIYR